MGEKKWQAHVQAALQSGLSLAEYARRQRIPVQRLYQTRYVIKQHQQRQAKRAKPSAFALVRLKPEGAEVNVAKVQADLVPTTIAMQARLGNGVILSWSHDQRSADAPSSVLRTLAALPCFI